MKDRVIGDRSIVPPNGKRLTPGAFQPLPLGQMRAAGWLRTQLRTQADGLTGHPPDFWPDVDRSREHRLD